MIIPCVQNSAEWLQIRTGLQTASRVKDVMARGVKGQPLQKRDDYLWELVCERRSGRAAEHYVTPAMDHGSAFEKEAREAYYVETGNEVEQVGIAIHPKIDFLAASPDGLVGADGMVEFKCPTMRKHYQWRDAGVVPEEHKAQCYVQMACWERKWVDFVSYHPDVPEGEQLFIVRLPWDEKEIARIEFAVIEFEGEIRETMARLDGKCQLKEKLRKSVAIDAAMFITEEDLPQWAREMRS